MVGAPHTQKASSGNAKDVGEAQRQSCPQILPICLVEIKGSYEMHSLLIDTSHGICIKFRYFIYLAEIITETYWVARLISADDGARPGTLG